MKPYSGIHSEAPVSSPFFASQSIKSSKAAVTKSKQITTLVPAFTDKSKIENIFTD